MKYRTLQAGLAVFLAGSVLAVGLTLLRYQAQAQGGSTLYVAPGGDCGGMAPCYDNLQDAVAAAQPLDTVLVAGGTYTDGDTSSLGYVVAVTKSMVLRGGYNPAFAGPPDPAAHPTVLDAQGQGRVITMSGDITPTIEGFVITGGDAVGRGGPTPHDPDSGGGICGYRSHPVITGNVIRENHGGAWGGGLFLRNCSRAVVSGNTIASNTGALSGSGLAGGLMFDYSDGIVVSDNLILSNTAAATAVGQGGGLYLYNSDATLSGNTIAGNIGGAKSGSQGGGVWLEYGIVTLRSNTLRDNYARAVSGGSGGGLRAVYMGGLTLDGNWITHNRAAEGGAMAVNRSTAFTLTNNLIAGNRATSQGDGLWIVASIAHPSSGSLVHNTVADNGVSDSEGVLYVGNYVALALTDTIVAGHAVGLVNSNPLSSTLSAAYTLFHDNGTDYGVGVTSTHEVHGDPRFVAPGAYDYHLAPGSAAANAGVAAGVTTDMDGDPRPIGAGFDIGADECRWPEAIYLPLTLRG